MAYPVYVTSRGVSVGGAMGLESSELLTIEVTVSSSRSLVWDASGYRFEQIGATEVSAAGSEVLFSLPVTDQSGWRDAKTGSLIDVSEPDSYTHRYTAEVRVKQGTRTLRIYLIGPFVLPTGEGTIDLDQMVPASTVSGELVNVPAVLQVAGLTGTVTTAQLAEAGIALVSPDTVIEYDIDGNVDSVTEGAITTTYTYNTDSTVATDTRLGKTRAYTYDGNGNLISIEEVA